MQQDKKIVVNNLDTKPLTKESLKQVRHSSLLPNTIRAIFVGPSNCGKTNVLISLIESPNGLKFRNVYLYSKSSYQPKYQYLKELIEPIKGMGFYSFSDNDKALVPEKAKVKLENDFW